MRTAVVAGVLASVLAGGASAQVNLTQTRPAYSYFHRVGADLATHDAELTDCVIKASQTRTFRQTLQKIQRGALFGMMADHEYRLNVAVNTENCMVVKGWEVVTVSNALGAQLMAQNPADVASGFLAERVGAPVVSGGVVRSWGNDAADARTVRFDAGGPENTNKPSISRHGLDEAPIMEALNQMGAPTDWGRVPAGAKPRYLSGGQFKDVPPGSALIVARIKGTGDGNGTGLTLERVGRDPMRPAWVDDEQVASIEVSMGPVGAKPEGRFVAVVAPPGEWRLASLGRMPVLNLCLGSPSFRLQAGEVLFAGTFDMSSTELKPNMETIAARKFLGSRPDLAEQLKPAVWTNGSTGRCGDTIIYALEFPVAP